VPHESLFKKEICNLFANLNFRRRMQAKVNEADQNLEAANMKISQLEKVKLRMSQEMEDLVIEVERVGFGGFCIV
jgi:hypothetical protein